MESKFEIEQGAVRFVFKSGIVVHIRQADDGQADVVAWNQDHLEYNQQSGKFDLPAADPRSVQYLSADDLAVFLMLLSGD